MARPGTTSQVAQGWERLERLPGTRRGSTLSMIDKPDEIRGTVPGPEAGEPSRPGRGPAGIRRVGTAGRRSLPFILGVLATFLAIGAFGILNPGRPPLTLGDVEQAVASALASQVPEPARSEAAYDLVRPSLVVIATDEAGTGGGEGHGLGSGVVINDAGMVLTALHVVSDATAIRITFADGTTSDATIAASEPDSDIAVLQPDAPPPGLIPATLGNPAAMRIGSEAYVVGHPFGLVGSLSSGVVSGLERSYEQPETERTISGLIQVDAAVNRGNSGGPLLDRDGRVVGIVTALLNPTDQDVFIGIGLAVPIDVAGGAAGLPPY